MKLIKIMDVWNSILLISILGMILVFYLGHFTNFHLGNLEIDYSISFSPFSISLFWKIYSWACLIFALSYFFVFALKFNYLVSECDTQDFWIKQLRRKARNIEKVLEILEEKGIVDNLEELFQDSDDKKKIILVKKFTNKK